MKLTISLLMFCACISSPIPDAPEDVLGTPITPDTVSVPPTPLTCVPGTPENMAVFGDGSDGDFIVPAGAQITLTRDMNWRNLTFQDGSSFVLTNGWAVHVSGTLSGPPSFGVASFRMNGRDASGATPGAGYPAGGSIMLGGSGTGGIPGDQGTTSLPGIWMSVIHPGAGGSGGGANGGPNVTGWAGPIAPFGLITDGLPASRMTLGDGTPLAGGAGGAGGTGGGAGGGGAGNVSVAAKQIVNAGRVFLQARGGAGGNATSGNGGGGGGGSGGYVTIVTGEGSPFPVVDITGGVGGHSFGAANNGGSGGDGSVLPYCVGSEVQDMVLEVFGTGSDGDFTIPPGTTFVMTRDMFWRNLTFPDHVTSFIDPNGFVIHVSGTLTAPAPPLNGEFQVFGAISRIGPVDAVGSVPGTGFACTGTINGGSGSGGTPTSLSGGSGTLPTTTGFANIWPDTWHPAAAGSGRDGTGAVGGTGSPVTIRPPDAGGVNLFDAMRLRLAGDDGGGNFLTSFMGGAGGGAGGPGSGGGLGGAGGAGGGNIVVIAKAIVNPENLSLSSAGGRGGDHVGTGGGGGGGGSGGFITFVTYRRYPSVVFHVEGGEGGSGPTGGTFGQSGGNGIVLPFSFVINS